MKSARTRDARNPHRCDIAASEEEAAMGMNEARNHGGEARTGVLAHPETLDTINDWVDRTHRAKWLACRLINLTLLDATQSILNGSSTDIAALNLSVSTVQAALSLCSQFTQFTRKGKGYQLSNTTYKSAASTLFNNFETYIRTTLMKRLSTFIKKILWRARSHYDREKKKQKNNNSDNKHKNKNKKTDDYCIIFIFIIIHNNIFIIIIINTTTVNETSQQKPHQSAP